MKQLSALLLGLACASVSQAWGPDSYMGITMAGSHDAAEAPNGQLIAALADTTANDGVLIHFLVSDDQGQSWSDAPYSIAGVGVCPRVRLLRLPNAVVCAYLDGTTVRFYNTATAASGAYLAYSASEFDAGVSSTGWIYLFVQLSTGNSIRRAGSGDGGITWTGNEALVTGNGAVPRVAVSPADTVILNYYGPVLADRPKSRIRAAFYNTSSPGNLNVSAASFQDVVTDETVDKWRYASAIRNGRVWFFWEQGPAATSTLHGRVSTNNGAVYGSPFQVAGGNGERIAGFNVLARAWGGTTRCELIYARYSVPASGDPAVDRLEYRTASAGSPSAFSSALAFSENVPRVEGINGAPALVPLANGLLGAAWGSPGNVATAYYFDLHDVVTGSGVRDAVSGFRLLGPAHGHLIIRGAGRFDGEAELRDHAGRLIARHALRLAAGEDAVLPVDGLPNGAYLITLIERQERRSMRFVQQP